MYLSEFQKSEAISALHSKNGEAEMNRNSWELFGRWAVLGSVPWFEDSADNSGDQSEHCARGVKEQQMLWK